MISVEQLWAEKYAKRFAAMEAEEIERRAEDFIDVTVCVCGLELRPLTPRDVLILDYAKNPFIAGGEITAAAVAQFLWQMHSAPVPRPSLVRCLCDRELFWAEKRFFRHCGALLFVDSVAAIQKYLDRTFADRPRGASSSSGRRSLGTSFVAPLIVRIAAGIPGLSPREIMDTPITQLFQYQKVLAADEAAKTGGKFRESCVQDRLLCECLEECHRLNAAEAASVQTQPISQ